MKFLHVDKNEKCVSKQTLKLTGLQSRFNDDDKSSGTTGGTTSTFSNNNGVFHSTSSVLNPDGSVTTREKSGKNLQTTQKASMMNVFFSGRTG